eukprot:gb/GECG01000859.1/.p1 GENE.gb/GECG01000859.1/~~gb/GECG01000859.1/.p1  ORF type:complete len:486 (+),score=63.02 gb/GECG01000859.1/:1-1458(+)
MGQQHQEGGIASSAQHEAHSSARTLSSHAGARGEGRPASVNLVVPKFKSPERPQTAKSVRFAPTTTSRRGNKWRRPTHRADQGPKSSQPTAPQRPATAPQVSSRTEASSSYTSSRPQSARRPQNGSSRGNAAKGQSYLMADIEEITMQLRHAWDRATEHQQQEMLRKQRRRKRRSRSRPSTHSGSRKKRSRSPKGSRAGSKEKERPATSAIEKSPNAPTPFPLPKDVEDYLGSPFHSNDVQVSLDAMKSVALYRTGSRSVFSPRRRYRTTLEDQEDEQEEQDNTAAESETAKEKVSTEMEDQRQNLLIDSPFTRSPDINSPIVAKRNISSSPYREAIPSGTGTGAFGGMRHFVFPERIDFEEAQSATGDSVREQGSPKKIAQEFGLDEGEESKVQSAQELRAKVQAHATAELRETARTRTAEITREIDTMLDPRWRRTHYTQYNTFFQLEDDPKSITQQRRSSIQKYSPVSGFNPHLLKTAEGTL